MNKPTDDTGVSGAGDGPGGAAQFRRNLNEPGPAMFEAKRSANAVDDPLPEPPFDAVLDQPDASTSTIPVEDRPDGAVASRREIVEQFSRFYRDRIKSLTVYLRHLGASWEDAADVAQETMRKAFEQWPTLRNPVAWTRLVAARDWKTSAARRREEPLPNDQTAGHVLLTQRDELAELDTRLELLGLSVDLPPRQREVLAATYDGATTAEIASDLELSPATVRSTLRHARNRLATDLRPPAHRPAGKETAESPFGQHDPERHRDEPDTPAIPAPRPDGVDSDQGGRS